MASTSLMKQAHGAVSASRFNQVLNRVKSAQMTKQKAIQKARHTFTAALDTGVTVGTGAAMGYIQGRHGQKKIGPVPLEVAVGVGFHVAGLLEPGGEKVARQFHNVGNGALTAYAVTVMRGHGRRARAKAGLGPVAGDSDMLGDSEGGGMQSEADLLRMAERA